MRQLMHSFLGKKPPSEIIQGVANGTISSFCLFNNTNIGTPQAVRELTDSLIWAANENSLPAPLIGIDQEGGQLMAITEGTTQLPGNMALGATRSTELAAEAGSILAEELLAMGINLNFAPSVDVNVNPSNPVIGTRSFGDNPELVAMLGTAMIRGMQDEGVLATAKHFPGHGDTSTDTHHTAPIVEHPLKRINEVELHPFRMAINAGVGAVMSSHIIYKALDSDNPATLSRKIMHDLLRGEMGFAGINITDAMDMHAVSQLGNETSVRRALSAGVDLICLAHLENQFALSEALRSLENVESIERIMAARRRIPTELPDLSVVGSQEHQDIAQEIADKSITVVRDSSKQIPLKPDDTKIAVITVRPADLTPADTSSLVDVKLASAIQKRHKNILPLDIPHAPEPNDIDGVLQAVSDSDTVIIGTISAEIFTGQATLVKALLLEKKSVIVVSLRTPYDIVAFPEIETYICAYSIRDVTTEAIAKVLFGEIKASGQLPCSIPGLNNG